MRRTPTSWFVLAVAVAVTAPCQSVLAQSGIRRVTMAEALGAFASNSLELRIARAEAEAAIGTARQYRTYANPAFSLVHESLGSSGDSYRETIAGIAQRVEWPGRTAARSGVAVHAIDGASARFRADSVRLAFQVREAYVAAWLAEDKERTTREAAGVIRLVAEAARQRLEEGDISRYEARRFELELVQAEREVAATALEARTARRTLAVLVSPEAEVDEVGPAEAIAGLPPAVTPASALAALGRRPDLEAAARDLDAARARSHVAMTTWLPDPTFSLGYKDQTDGLSGAALSVNLPVPVFDRGIGQRHGAAAQETAATHRLELARRLAEMDLIAAADRYTSTRTQFEAAGEDPLADADFLLRTARALYAEGEMSQLELLDAAAIFRDARIATLSLRGATWIAYYDLLRAMARAPDGES
ncbi:MAG: TolC family protein [Gemmatimonadetes bacterium]|nr:TolC family protein [Gemmatimonadota bacterium]